MAETTSTTRFHLWLWLIFLIGVIVPRRLRADWRQEWEAELRYRETLLARACVKPLTGVPSNGNRSIATCAICKSES